MRVLHVISSLEPKAGGPTTALLGLAAAQARVGLAVSALSTFTQPEEAGARGAADTLRAANVAVTLVGPAHGRFARHPDLAAAVDAAVAQADVVHVHALWEEVQHQAARAAHRRNVPYLIRPCGMLDPWSLAQSKWPKRLVLAWRVRKNLNHAAAIHYTTTAERDLAAPLHLRAPALVEPNGVDLGEFAQLPPPGTFRAHHPQLADKPFVLFMSRVHPKKGLDLLLPAFATVAKSTDAMLVIAGPAEPDYLDQVRAMAATANITDRVLLVGMLQGPQRLAALAEAALFVLPSYQENFGNVVIESCAAGTPVIISDQVNLHDEITTAQVGAVVPTQVEPLATTLLTWLTTPALRTNAAARAKPFVATRFNWFNIAERWKSHYATLVSRASRP